MNVKEGDTTSENYAIISYSRRDTEAVKHELETYDANNICYWFDKSMMGGESYESQFFEKLENPNCKGIIFFMSEEFLLSQPCGREMEHFLNKYGVNNEKKFCLFIMPKNFPASGDDQIYGKVMDYHNKTYPNDYSKTKKLPHHIDLLLKLNENGKAIYVTLGNGNNYIETYCEEGQLFREAAIIFGHTHTNEYTFGYFPQNQKKVAGASGVNALDAKRALDKQPAYYSKINWLIISDNDKSATLLSRDLLFAVNYLDLKYPLKPGSPKVSEVIKEIFIANFRDDDEKKWKIKNVRFLSDKELDILLARAQKDPRKIVENKSKVLLPKETFFSQAQNRSNIGAFWLAGDMDNARRVDLWKESPSDMELGAETYHVRVVVDVDKS